MCLLPTSLAMARPIDPEPVSHTINMGPQFTDWGKWGSAGGLEDFNVYPSNAMTTIKQYSSATAWQGITDAKDWSNGRYFIVRYVAPATTTLTINPEWYARWDVGVSSGYYGTNNYAGVQIILKANAMDLTTGQWVNSNWNDVVVKDWYVNNGNSYSQHSESVIENTIYINMIAGHTYDIRCEAITRTYCQQMTGGFSSSSNLDLSGALPFFDGHQDESMSLSRVVLQGYW
jgi:hypothetical protein